MRLHDQIKPDELIELLKLRANKEVDFVLIDVREAHEYEKSHIDGTDYLIPTSTFQRDVRKILKLKNKNIILYCRASRRSLIYQNILKETGFFHVSNMMIGINGYNGKKRNKN